MESKWLSRGSGAKKYLQRVFESRTGGQRLSRLGASRPIVKGVGDRDPGVGLLTGVDGLAIGMVAPDKVAPAGCELIERQRRAKAELRRDLGRCLAGTPSRLARRRLRGCGADLSARRSSPRRGRNRALPPEPGAGPKATPRTRAPPVGPAPRSSGALSLRPASSTARSKVSLRRSDIGTRLASASARRGAPIARRRLGGFVIGIVGHHAVPSLDFGLVEAFIDASQ